MRPFHQNPSMLIHSLWFLLRVTPMAVSVMLMAALSARASEATAAAPATNAALLTPIDLSLQTGATSTPIELNQPLASDQLSAQPLFASAEFFQAEAGTSSVAQTQGASIEDQRSPISDTSRAAINNHAVDHAENGHQFGDNSTPFAFSKESQLVIQPSAVAPSDSIRDSVGAEHDSLKLDQAQFNQLALTDVQSLTAQTRLIAQAQEPPESGPTQPEPSTQSPTSPPSDTTGEAAKPPRTRWRFSFQPYGFVPLEVQGSVRVRDFTTNFNLGLSDILTPLNFAAAGRFEAWHGNLGLIFDGAYFSAEQDGSRSFNVPNCLDCILPSQIDTKTTVHFGQFDLAVGYRLAAANPATAATEFDLGPMVLDVMAGMRIYALQAEIDIDSNLGTSRNLSRDSTIVEPLLSARLRWNVSHNLAVWSRGDIAGFGIQGLTLSWAFTSGIDWMFSGNTSLLLAYRFSGIQYNADNVALDLFFQGPYLGVQFRF